MKFFIFLLMLPHMKPACAEYLWPAIGAAFDVGRLFSALMILFLYILKKKLPSMPVWALAVLQGWLIFTSLLNGKNLQSALVTAASILAVAMLIDFFSSNPMFLLKGMMFNLEILTYCNLLSVIFRPNGLYISVNGNLGFFLGHRNQFIVFVLPAIVIALLYINLVGIQMRPILLIAAGCAQIVMVWSATSVCGLLAFAAILFLYRTSARKAITYQNIFAVMIVIDLLISVFRVMDQMILVAYFIESFLRKQITLTGRTRLWDSFYQRFFRSPWIGYGIGAESIVGTNLTAHNQWFQFLLEGGILGLILFLMFNYSVGKILMQNKDLKLSRLFNAFFSAVYILFIADVYLSSPWLYAPFILACHIDKFEAASRQIVRKPHTTKRGHHVSYRKFPEKH